MSRVLRDLATSRADQVVKLRRAAADFPLLARLFTKTADALESSVEVPFDVNESFRWTPVQAEIVALAGRALDGTL
jgi:hypothetical protein